MVSSKRYVNDKANAGNFVLKSYKEPLNLIKGRGSTNKQCGFELLCTEL